MSTKLVIQAPEEIIPAKTLEVVEIGIRDRVAGVAFSDGSVTRVPLSDDQDLQIKTIILGEVVKVEPTFVLESVVTEAPAPKPDPIVEAPAPVEEVI